MQRALPSPLFPYTTLFRSQHCHCLCKSCDLLRFFYEQEYQKAPERLRSEEHTSELQSLRHLVCRLLLEKKKKEAGPPRFPHRVRLSHGNHTASDARITGSV